MADRELRRMSRADLIEIIYELRKNEAALQAENEALRQQLEDRNAKISKAGSLAELSASLNGLFEAAQATADQYLKEIRVARKQAQALRVDSAKLAQMTLDERERILKQTEQECEQMRAAAAAGRRIPKPQQIKRVPRPSRNPAAEEAEDV